MDSNVLSCVLDVLQRVCNQNPEILKPAESQLKEWETKPGFYSVLFSIISHHSVDFNVRWIAAVYFKNGIDKYWRKNAPNGIPEDEKKFLRQVLITNLREPVNQIATQLAVLVSKVARYDYPKEWPELIPTLLQGIESNDKIMQHRSLLTLHHVVKSISSKRLAGDKKNFQDFTASIYSYILNLWNNYTEAFLNDINNNQPAEIITNKLENALLALRILRKLTVYGLKKPSDCQDAMCFLKVIFPRTKSTLEARKLLRGKGIYLLELCEKFIVHLTKVLLGVLDMHPVFYVDLIHDTLEFTVYFLFSVEGTPLTYERFVIQCFNLMKGILLCAEYKLPKIIAPEKNFETIRAYQIKQTFLHPTILVEMCKKLISHYFLLTQDDLELWDADPETFVTDEAGESWKYNLRPCIETVFVTIFHEFREILTPVLLEMIQSTNVFVPPTDLRAILQKDAIYNAVGLSAFDLYDEVDFDSWFTNTLTEELKIKDNNYRIIRKRVAWVIGHWIGVKLSPALRPRLYCVLLELLNTGEDIAVRIEAAQTLKQAVDDFEFVSEQFHPYLDATFNLLFMLLKESHESDTKMLILNIMTIIIERVSIDFRPHSDILVQYLPLLWQEAENHNMLRCAIITTLVQLLKTLSEINPSLLAFLMPLIQLGTDTTQDPIVYLLEDTLELWLVVLENSKTMTNELIQQFNVIPSLLEYSSENLRICLSIIHAHILLAPEQTLKNQIDPVIIVCDNLLVDFRTDGVITLMRIVEICIKVSPTLGIEKIKYILPRIFEAVHRSEATTSVMVSYLSIMSRVLLSSFTVYSEIITRVSQVLNDTPQNVFNRILDNWLTKLQNVAQPERRKLLAMALANLLTVQSHAVLERFNKIIISITEVLNDIMKTDENGVEFDALVFTEEYNPSYHEDDCQTEHSLRNKQLSMADPVHNITLVNYLQSQLVQLKNQLGNVQYDQLVQTVNSNMISQLQSHNVVIQ